MKAMLTDMPNSLTSVAEMEAWRECTEYMLDKAEELIALAYAGYTKLGRGVLFVGFSERGDNGIPLLYAPRDDLAGAKAMLGPSAYKATLRNVGLYDPEQGACLAVFVFGEIVRTTVLQSRKPTKELFAENAEQYLAQIESPAQWARKWGKS